MKFRNNQKRFNHRRSKRQKRLQAKKQHEFRWQSEMAMREQRQVKTMGLCMDSIWVQNDDAEIVSTNYWKSSMAEKGFYFLSINAGAFRLLVPERLKPVIQELRSAQYCIISKGPSLSPLYPYAIELLFEDNTSTPYHLILCERQLDRNPSGSDAGRVFKFSVWTKGCEKALEMDAYFRVVDRIPYLKELGKELENEDQKGDHHEE